MSKRDIKFKVVYFGIVFALVLVVVFSGLRIVESTVFIDQQVPTETTASKTVTRNGVDYFPRQDITVVMILGIDEFGPVTPSEYHTNNGTADMVMLLIFDETNKTVDVLQINRETMLDVSVLGLNGKPAGTYYGQVALAYSYGKGLEDSCENTKKTLESFLHGLSIDYYVSMKMDAISILNDAVGGVTVNVVDDFSKIDPTITMGEVTLHGDQVINFVRTRKDVGDQKNVSRMERQKEYIDGFLEKLRQKGQEDIDFMIKTYDAVSPYIVTDCSANTLNSMLDRYSDYELNEITTPEGENIIGEKYYEFYPDPEKLDELILRLFYAKK